jgi:hypothetical protein
LYRESKPYVQHPNSCRGSHSTSLLRCRCQREPNPAFADWPCRSQLADPAFTDWPCHCQLADPAFTDWPRHCQLADPAFTDWPRHCQLTDPAFTDWPLAFTKNHLAGSPLKAAD